MRVDHDLVLGSLLDGIQVVVVERLAVMMLATGQHVAYVSALYGVVAILVHQIVGILHAALIIARRA